MAAGRMLVTTLGAMMLLYLVAVAALFLLQRRFIYPAPPPVTVAPDAGFTTIQLTTDDELTLRALYRPARPGMPTLIFFHGNGSDLRGSQRATRDFGTQGYGVMLSEYRGYGGNPGSPTEQGLYRDGDAALAWLAANGIASNRLVIIGNSLGSGVATEMAVRHRPLALVLISGFASMPRVAQDHFPWVPAGLLVLDRYDNVTKLRSLDCPIFLLHGTADTVARVDNARSLAAAQPLATLELIPKVGHELAYLDIAAPRVMAWLRSSAMIRTRPL